MSGEPIVLAGAEDGNAARLVRATARLGEAHLGPHALIGGLAVMRRLAAVHRATQDVDTVIETTAPTAIQVIASSTGTPDPTNPGSVFVDGVKIDVIDTESFRYGDLEFVVVDAVGAEALTPGPCRAQRTVAFGAFVVFAGSVGGAFGEGGAAAGSNAVSAGSAAWSPAAGVSC